MTDQARIKPDRMPWAFAAGVVALVLGVIGAGSGSPFGVVVLIVGVLLICTGLIQRSIERSRR